MRKVIRFSKLFLPAAIFSVCLIVAGLVSYFVMGGFNLGVDFKAGVIQEVKFAPTAFSLTWSGVGNASISFDRNGIHIVNSGIGVDPHTTSFPFTEYRTIGALTQAMEAQIEGIEFQLDAPGGVSSQWLVFRALADSSLSNVPYAVHYLDPQAEVISIAEVRDSLSGFNQSVSVQSLGQPQDRHFMIRVDDKGEDSNLPAEKKMSSVLIEVLEESFGAGEVVVLRSDSVDSRFAKNLTDQAGILVSLTLLIMLLYVTVRFKPQYGIGLVLGIIHDGIVIVAFVVWTGMEFNTTTIAALLTILGYSTNNTIVVFDRIRENRRIYPDELYVNVLNMSLTATLNRTIITTLTTMLAVVSLFIFTTGAMKDFALALLVGLTSGVYTTTFIVSGFVNLWEVKKVQREKRKLLGGNAGVSAKKVIGDAIDAGVTGAIG